MSAASHRPSVAATTSNSTTAFTPIVREPSAICVQWNPNRVPSSSSTVPRPRRSSNATTRPVAMGQWTIFAIGSSMMSVAPASFRAGMRMLISDFATTVSTA